MTMRASRGSTAARIAPRKPPALWPRKHKVSGGAPISTSTSKAPRSVSTAERTVAAKMSIPSWSRNRVTGKMTIAPPAAIAAASHRKNRRPSSVPPCASTAPRVTRCPNGDTTVAVTTVDGSAAKVTSRHTTPASSRSPDTDTDTDRVARSKNRRAPANSQRPRYGAKAPTRSKSTRQANAPSGPPRNRIPRGLSPERCFWPDRGGRCHCVGRR